MDNDTTMGQLIAFDRSAEYLRRVAIRQRKEGRLLPALEMLRRSLEKEPDSPETLLEIAKTYARMHCPGLSNRALFRLFGREELAPECFYRAGLNFFQMNMEKSARDCLVLYLQKKPGGRFMPDATDMIDALEDDPQAASSLDMRINRRTARVLMALDKGRPLLAARLARRVLALEKRSSGTHALLTFALLECGNREAALRAARTAMRLNAEDIRALCAMAAALYAIGSRDTARIFLGRAADRVEGAEDSELVCRTACDMGDHAHVRTVLKALEPSTPLSDELLHLLAAASFNVGDRDEAIHCWTLLRRIDPMDATADYRLKAAEAGTLLAPVPYFSEVPRQEVFARLTCLRTIVTEGVEGICRHWVADDGLERLVRWGLSSSEPGIPEAMMGLMSSLPGSCAAPLLDLLSNADIADDQKRNALATLCLMGQNGPFYALIGERITLVHVARAEKEGDEAQVEALARHVRNRLGGLHEREERMLLPLCRAALSQRKRTSATFRLRGVELAVRRLRGEGADALSSPSLKRRLSRFASRIMKEATADGMH